ncbi:MAG: hypothetical protein DWQ04_28755 [Chloroflexi bacterium]|nr:MAG: hypothetical protein DWQ04_28755 [Chloroflexota bacterium]
MYNMAIRTGTTIATIQRVNCYFSNMIYIGQLFWLPFHPPPITPTPQPKGCDLPINIEAVDPGRSVTFVTINYPAYQTFTVTMGPAGTQGIDGTVVGTFGTGTVGSLINTFNIPANLQENSEIDIRVSTAHAEPYCGYTTFRNNSSTVTVIPQPDFTVDSNDINSETECTEGGCTTVVNFIIRNIEPAGFNGTISYLAFLSDGDGGVIEIPGSTNFNFAEYGQKSVTTPSVSGLYCDYYYDCSVSVFVDSNNAINETNEENNRAIYLPN